MPPDPPRGKWARTRLTSASRWTIARAVSSVVVPVSIAMALCVWLVLLLRDDFGDAATTGGIFNAVYTEKVRADRLVRSRSRARVAESVGGSHKDGAHEGVDARGTRRERG